MFGLSAWHNEPRQWSLNDGELTVHSDDKTDFWRDTYYGFTRDSGHFLARGGKATLQRLYELGGDMNSSTTGPA